MSRLARLARSPFWLGPIVAGWGLLVFSSAASRGFDYVGVWQLERAESARQWLEQLAQGGGSSVDAARAALVADPYQGPLNGLIPAALWRLFEGADGLQVVRLTNALMVCLCMWCLFTIGRRMGGPLAGLGAAVALISVPRIWAAATSPGFTAPALLAFTLAGTWMARGRDRLPYALAAVLALAAALLTTQLAVLLALPWIYLTFFDDQSSEGGPLMRARPLTLWAPFVLPAALMVVMLSFPPFRQGGLEELLNYLKAFAQLPREATLYLGELYTEHRLPWHAAFVVTAVTVPPTVLFLTVFGVGVASPLTRWVRRLLRRAAQSPPGRSWGEARLAWSMLLLTLALPLLLGTSRSHGVDLMALPLPWCAVFAGVGLERMLKVVGARLQAALAGRRSARLATLIGVTTLGWGVFVFAFKDTEEAYPEVEGYYSWLVGGVDTAARLGLPRNPHGPVPPQFLDSLVDPAAEVRLAIIPEDTHMGAVLDQYRAHGLIPAGLASASPQDADVVVFRFDESSPAFYQLLPDFFGTVRSAGSDAVRWITRQGLPLFGAVRF